MALQVIQIITEDEFDQKLDSRLEANNQKLLDQLLARLGMRSNEPRYYSRKEAARKLNITLPTLHLWTQEGKIIGHRVGSRVLYKEEDINNALQKIQTSIRATA